MTLTLAQFANHLNGSPIQPLIRAQLTRTLAGWVKDASTSSERRNWALDTIDRAQSQLDPLVMALVLTNPSISQTLAAGNLPPDGDLEYVLLAEVLPHIAPT